MKLTDWILRVLRTRHKQLAEKCKLLQYKLLMTTYTDCISGLSD